MKRRFYSIVAILMALLMCAFCFASCKKTETPPAETTAQSTPPTPENFIELISKGKANVRIVYETTGGVYITDASATLQKTLKELGGAEISIVIDMLSEKKEEDLEIIIGEADYAVSKEAMSALAPNSYSITVSGNKIVVVANNASLYSIAVDELVKAMSVSDGTVALAENFSKKSESLPVLSLAADKKSDYTIIYAIDDQEAYTQAIALKNAFFAAGVNVPVSGDTKNASGKEILIGATNRAISKESKAYYLNSYTACDENGNLAITGNVKSGVETISGHIEKLSRKSSNIDIPEILLGLATPKGYGNAPKYEGSGTVKLHENHESSYSYYIQASNATESDYKNYINKLTASGFELYYSTDAQESSFSTYTDGYNIVNLSYIEYTEPLNEDDAEHYINIAIDSVEHSALPKLEDKSEKVTDIQVTMINSQCALLIRLEDGRFIFYDGGVNSQFDRNTADLVYKTITEQNVLDGKPVIAAWYVSHHHGDHVGGFLSVMAKYKNNIVLESVIHNAPGKAAIGENITDGTLYEYGWINNLYNGANQNFPEAKIIIAHAGQRFAYAGLTVDVLYTPENYYGSEMFYGNHEVSIYSFDTDNGRMILTGDAQPENCKMVAAIYAEELQADFVQYAHHGYRGGEPTFYDFIGARYGLWTRDIESLKEDGKRPQPNYNGVDPNSFTKSLVPTNTEAILVFTADMTKADLEKYIYKTW